MASQVLLSNPFGVLDGVGDEAVGLRAHKLRGATSLSPVRGKASNRLQYQELQAMQVQLTRRLEESGKLEQQWRPSPGIDPIDAQLLSQLDNTAGMKSTGRHPESNARGRDTRKRYALRSNVRSS